MQNQFSSHAKFGFHSNHPRTDVKTFHIRCFTKKINFVRSNLKTNFTTFYFCLSNCYWIQILTSWIKFKCDIKSFLILFDQTDVHGKRTFFQFWTLVTPTGWSFHCRIWVFSSQLVRWIETGLWCEHRQKKTFFLHHVVSNVKQLLNM